MDTVLVITNIALKAFLDDQEAVSEYWPHGRGGASEVLIFSIAWDNLMQK